MFRTKQSVDRHVQELFRKIKDENERTLRCYNIAKLYFQVQDYDSARRYVSCYLEMKGDQAGPHKLLGEIYEALGQKESALAQYKQSLEIEPRQDDLVLKVCELLADEDIALDVNRVKYWVERAEPKFLHHPTVFKLKEKLLTVDRPNNGGEDLEALIAAELSARPSDVQLRVKLLKYYMDKNKLEAAYKHALEVESTRTHRDSVTWYEALCELLTKCKEVRLQKWTFWVLYVSSLERYATLSLKEQGHVLKKTVSEAVQAVFNFDQALTEARLQNFMNATTLADHMFTHMWGQLNYHLACLLLRKTKREQGSWSDAGRLCAPLLLTAMHVAPIDTTAPWASKLNDQTKAEIQLWRREGSYRCSQAGHVLQEYARDDTKRLMDKIDKFCVGSWRERIYQRIFVSKAHISTSYFANHSEPNPPLRLSSATELKLYDQVAEEVWPASLHHHVWLGVLDRPRNNRSNNYDDSGPHPHQHCHVFPDLQISVINLSQAAPDSLGQLDIDAFLNAAVLCASMVVEEHQRSSFLSPDRLPTLPADITNTLCTSTQEKWWSSAYKIYLKQDGISGDLGEIRQDLQRGLEVVRCIGNHGLHPAILVHLARIFHHRAKLLKEKDKNHTDLPSVEARCELYWTAVVPLLERLLNNQAIRTTSTKMFDYQGKEMNNVELTNALEEGRLLLAQRYIREKQHEQAIEALQALKCPEASFMQGEIYKSLADELVSTVPKESLTSAMRSQHVTTLGKARGCYYLTLDRLRSPGMNPKHPLNSELGSRIADIENDLRRIDPDLWRANRNDCDALSDESFSSAQSGEQQLNQNSFTGLGNTMPMLGTPQRNTHRPPKQASTPCRIPHQDILELTRKSVQQEARPSPERLDAQIRQLVYTKDNLLQTILEQNKTLLEANKSLVETTKSMNDKIEDLQKQFAELRKETQQSKQSSSQQQQQQQRARSTSVTRNNLEEDLYVLGNEDYPDLNYSTPQPTAPTPQIPGHLYGQQQRLPSAPMYYQPVPPAGYYGGGAIPFTEPHTQHIPSLYPPGVFQMPALYPRPPTMDPNLGGIPKMAENIQGIFTTRLLNQLTELVPPHQQQQQQHQQQPQQQSMQTPLQAPQLSMQLQHFDVTRNEIPAKDVPVQPVPKDLPVNRAPPVNVVITTSDTLPTTVPTVQPTLSVTIPAQYRAGGINNVPTTTVSTAPHSYQISMPSQATIPTTVNLPPLSTTITNTISATVAEQERIVCKNGSVLSTSIQNYSSESAELEHDPLPDFVPVIPLPAEVKVTTGEEDETSLFCARAKLYRWSDKEWKERGVGNVKLLRNDEGKVRLVMRREQVLKICANHMLTPDMELTAMMSNERAWIWVANDFADEEVKLEKLCIKFKYVEEAQAFKENFDKAKLSVPVASSKAQAPIETKNEKIEKKDDSIGFSYSGFTFTTKPVIQTPATPEPAKPSKPEESSKPSPFAGFSFAKTTSSETPSQTGGFSFGKPTNFTSPKPTQNVAPSVDTTASRSSLRRPHAPAPTELATGVTNEPGKNSEGSTEIVGTVNDDGEYVVYEKKANLSRCNIESLQWKNRGSGTVKIIVDTKNEKIRLIIRRDENNKLFYNQHLLPTTKFSTLIDTDNVITWTSYDTGKGTGKIENFAVLFETWGQASDFLNRIIALQQSLTGDRLPPGSLRLEGKSKGPRSLRLVVSNAANAFAFAPLPVPSLAEMFKPATGSWECTMCYTRNESTAAKCVACQADSPSSAKANNQFETIPEKPSMWTQFKPAPESWECQSCYIRNPKENVYCVACDTAKDPAMPPKPKTGGFNLSANSSNQTSGFNFGMPVTPASTPQQTLTPLSEMFKPQPGSWECQGCLVRNSESTNHCSACEAPKDPSIPAKPKIGFFNSTVNASVSAPTFSFGINQEMAKETSTTGFMFKMPSADEKAAGDASNATVSIFGNATKPPTQPSTDFVFGIVQRPSTPPNTEGNFAFGSPGKSFQFSLQPKSPIKSPGGRGDASEDEVAESEDIYFTPVIPLPEKVEVKTGEEDEEIVYTHRAKLFRYDVNAKEWKERGLGDIKLLRHNITKKLRMVMRRDQTLKLCLNHVVPFDLELKPKDDKTWLWSAADYSEGDIEHLQLACRFKTPEIAADFKSSVDNALKIAKKSTDDETSKEQQQEQSLSKTPSFQDIQVVYEVTVTADEKAAAMKLQLPENFYAYKQKDDCPGCLGCREPDVPLFDDVKTKQQNNALVTPSSAETTTEKPKIDVEKTVFSPMTPKIAPPKFTSPTSSSNSAKNDETTVPATTTSLVFGGGFIQKPTISFATTSASSTAINSSDDSSKTDKKPSSFVFGSQNQESKPNLFGATVNNQQTNKSSPFTSSTFTAENLSICSPSANATTQQNTNFGGRMQSPFGATSFGNSGQTSSIFGGTPTSGSTIFGGSATGKLQSETTDSESTNALASPFPNIFGAPAKTTAMTTPSTTAPVFGAGLAQPSFGTQSFGASTTVASATTTTNVFRSSGFNATAPTLGSVATGTNIFGGSNQLSSKLSFGGLATTANNVPGATANANSMDGNSVGKQPEITSSVSFLPVDNTATFSDLAAQSPQQPSFTKDPNFSFAGAGASVFGAKSTTPSSVQNSKSPAAAATKKNVAEDEADEEHEDDGGQEYDPHFEPIIPLPDTIEVRTGEEEEEKVFCQRAKLYRYESETKEWKERGTGEMKLLYHAESARYRLLLRREQVHKVVCNQLVTAELELRPLHSSDRAWMWAGVNHAEEPYAIEELAVRFKNPELAAQFKEAVDKAKADIQKKVERQNSEEDTTWVSASLIQSDPTECYGEDQEDEGDEDEDDEEDEEHSMMFFARADLLTLQDNIWKSSGAGFLKILYDSEIYGAKIIFEVELTGEMASNTVISMETTMEINENTCIWTAIDEVPNPPIRRSLKAVFDSPHLAQEMYMNFQDGQEYAKQADISEAAYYDPRIE